MKGGEDSLHTSSISSHILSFCLSRADIIWIEVITLALALASAQIWVGVRL